MSMINIKQSIMVKPSEETPLKTIHLSKLDTIIRAPRTHTNIFYIYKRPSPPISARYFDAETLKNALSKILVPYYPMAGRLQINPNNDRYVINCNAKGALFVEAETSLTLDALHDFKPSATLRELMIPTCDYNGQLSSIPLIMVQVTWFKCGGLAIGFAPHHHVADGAAHIDFFAKLVRLAGGSNLPIQPIHDRVHLAPRDPYQIKFRHLHEFKPIVPSLPSNELSTLGDHKTTQSLFKLSKQQIQALKQMTQSQAMKYTKTTYKISTYATVAGHIWRSVCIARDLSYDQEVKIYIPVDGRSRLTNPVIPHGYCGNVLFFAICTAKAGDIMHKPLWYATSKIQEAITKMDDEYLRSSIDYLELNHGLQDPLMGGHKIMYPNLLINSWIKLPFYEADFGWGPPKVVGNCEIKLEGLSFLMGSTDEDQSLTLAINLFSTHMPRFRKHLYNHAYANIYSSL